MSGRYTTTILTAIAALLVVTILRSVDPGLTNTVYAAPTGDSTGLKSIQKGNSMELGNFCNCLTVKDIAASREFYEKLGFTAVSGDQAQNWLVMKSGETKIGLFQGMFDKNMMSFNPGWDSNGQPLPSFTDIREIQRQLKAKGITFSLEADEKTTGPASFMIQDPDGNPILFDQFR
jgi:catechol 2,3-dioxygenase-like lactoylglutathione lyase family enzyme